MEYDMGFVAASRRPMTQRDRYVEMVESFLETVLLMLIMVIFLRNLQTQSEKAIYLKGG